MDACTSENANLRKKRHARNLRLETNTARTIASTAVRAESCACDGVVQSQTLCGARS